MSRVYNFSAGPAVLPESVLQEAAAEMLDYRGTGMSVMEMSHRSKTYQAIIDQAEADLRTLMGIPDNYKVLFMQGGASQQFAMVPMNLMKNRVADYIITGQWAKKAWQEAKMYGTANAVASSADKTFSYIPDCSDLPIDENADYVYICENNTIYGTKFWQLPNTKGKPLVSDVSSCFLSEPVDVTKYGMLYGGVQKNIGPAGVVIAVIQEDLITEVFGVDGELLEHQYRDHLGSYMSWSQLPHAEEWILFEKNIGPYVDIDEVSFSQGELYIILISQGDKESFGKCHCNHKRYGYQDCYSRPAKAFQTHTA